MTKKDFDFVVFIGRFQPFHNGHLSVIQAGLRCSKSIIVICGSAYQARSTRNPWSESEREAMIRGSLSEADNARLYVAPLLDLIYNDPAWVKNVQAIVGDVITRQQSLVHNLSPKTPNIAIIGHSKDHSDYYVYLFPLWGAVEAEHLPGINATAIREAIFVEQTPEQVADLLPENVYSDIRTYCDGENYLNLKAEHEFVASYKQAWQAAPYPPTFVTVDAVLVQYGHILLVERKDRPGKGLLALPGGFVDEGETLVDACLRELREETCLKVPVAVLKNSIRGREVFDAPYRSARGRTITHGFYIQLAAGRDLPKVEGGDDARAAMWVPLADLNTSRMFEDHYSIIFRMVGL